MSSPSAALRRSRAFALSATPEKLAGGGSTTADYVIEIVSKPAGAGGESLTPYRARGVVPIMCFLLSWLSWVSGIGGGVLAFMSLSLIHI